MTFNERFQTLGKEFEAPADEIPVADPTTDHPRSLFYPCNTVIVKVRSGNVSRAASPSRVSSDKL
jgi:hypothetical protein